MMIEPSINELDKFVDSRYSLVCAVAKRARELSDGSEPLVCCTSEKEVSVAACELAQSKIRVVEKSDDENQEELTEDDA